LRKITKEDLCRLFTEAFERLDIPVTALSTIFNFGESSDSARSAMSAKINSRKGKLPTASDVQWIQALVVLKDEGYDITSIIFSEFGKIEKIEKTIK
jgi:hypothetical protein